MAFRKHSGQQSSNESKTVNQTSSSRLKTERDGPYSQDSQAAIRRKDRKQWAQLTPDKELETTCLRRNFIFVVANLPPEDVAPQMYNRQLLTQRENDEYHSMKKSRFSGIDKSEYLIECLLRRQAGALQLFCEILDDIAPAKHISDKLKEDYRNICIASYNRRDSAFCPENRDRYSKLSLSDPDIRIKDVAQQCTQCKVLERQNEKLDQRCRWLTSQLEAIDAEYQQLYASRLKAETYIEIAKEQFKRENGTLRELVTKLQSEVIQRGTRDRNIEETFSKLEQIFAENKKPPGRPILQTSFSLTDSEDDYATYVPLSTLVLGRPSRSRYHPSLPTGLALDPMQTHRAKAQSDSLKSAADSLVLGLEKQNVRPLPIEEEEHDYENIDDVCDDVITSPDSIVTAPSPQPPPRVESAVPSPKPSVVSPSVPQRSTTNGTTKPQTPKMGDQLLSFGATSYPQPKVPEPHNEPPASKHLPTPILQQQMSPDQRELEMKLSKRRQKIEQSSH